LETSYNVTEGSPSEQFATYIQVKPEKLFFGRRPPVPLCNTEIDMIVGEPIEFDLVGLKQEASMIPHDSSSERKGCPTITQDVLD
jgi:monolysocardiolipin acyltransferase